MLPDTTYETVQRAFDDLFVKEGEYTPLYAAVQDVYDRGGGVSVSLTLSIAQVGDQQVDVQVSAAVTVNENERPVWKAERVKAEKRIRINDRQIRLPLTEKGA